MVSRRGFLAGFDSKQKLETFDEKYNLRCMWCNTSWITLGLDGGLGVAQRRILFESTIGWNLVGCHCLWEKAIDESNLSDNNFETKWFFQELPNVKSA